jgi:hypothetical protein
MRCAQKLDIKKAKQKRNFIAIVILKNEKHVDFLHQYKRLEVLFFLKNSCNVWYLSSDARGVSKSDKVLH